MKDIKKQETLKDYKNIVIIGNDKEILAANYSYQYIDKNNEPNSIKRFSKKLPMFISDMTIEDIEKKQNKITELNTLYILNKYLKKIKTLSDKNKNITNIAIEHTLYDKITKNTYKNWIMTGKTSNNISIPETEITLWTEFMNNYREVFDIVNFIDINLYKGNKRIKYNKNKIEYGRLVYAQLLTVLKADEEIYINNSLESIL